MIPDPYDRSTFRGKPLDNATITRLEQVERDLGYELTVLQGIGGAAASSGTHLEGRAVDLAPWDWENKVRVLTNRGFAAWYRPAVAGLWPAHIHAVLIFDGRNNHRGIAESAWRQIGSYDRRRNGLSNDGPDTFLYRPSPPRGFSMEDYRRAHVEPRPKKAVLDLVTFNAWVGNKALRTNLRRLAEDTGRPEVFSLQEVRGETVKLSGYTTVAADPKTHPHPEARSNVLLVRNKGVEILTSGVVDVAHYDKTGWRWGPKDQPKTTEHPPKVYPWARLRHDEAEWVVLACHRVAGGFNLNRREWAAEDEALENWFDRRPAAVCIAAGDWNDTLDSRQELGVAALAKRVQARSELVGIDGALIRGADRTRSHKLDGRYGSDGHRPVIVTSTKEIR